MTKEERIAELEAKIRALEARVDRYGRMIGKTIGLLRCVTRLDDGKFDNTDYKKELIADMDRLLNRWDTD